MAPERPSDDRPSRAEVRQRISSLYDQAESATGNFNATRAMSKSGRARGGSGVWGSSRGSDPALDRVARQWFDAARAQLGPTVPAVLPPDRMPSRANSRTEKPSRRPEDVLEELGLKSRPSRLELTAGPAQTRPAPELPAGPTAAAPAPPVRELPAAPPAATSAAPVAELTSRSMEPQPTGAMEALTARSMEPRPTGTVEPQPTGTMEAPAARSTQAQLTGAMDTLTSRAMQPQPTGTMDALTTRPMEPQPTGALDALSSRSMQPPPTGSMDVLGTGPTEPRPTGPIESPAVGPAGPAFGSVGTLPPAAETRPQASGAPRVLVAGRRQPVPRSSKGQLQAKLTRARELLSRHAAQQGAAQWQQHSTGLFDTTPPLDGNSLFDASQAVGQAAAVDNAAASLGVAETPASAYERKAAKALEFARAQIGRPCVWGATGPDSYDCSSLIQAAWRAAGVALPRAAFEQAGSGTPVELADLRPGDLVFFYSEVNHVGLYAGSGTMVHAPSPGASIREESIFFAGPQAIHSAIRPA
ncbi:NlpC/P60 family protein [Streptomyces sp. JNUCC 63]